MDHVPATQWLTVACELEEHSFPTQHVRVLKATILIKQGFSPDDYHIYNGKLTIFDVTGMFDIEVEE